MDLGSALAWALLAEKKPSYSSVCWQRGVTWPFAIDFPWLKSEREEFTLQKYTAL